MKNKNNRISLDLSNCLDLIDKDNIQIEESDNGEIHITAQLWLWDCQYIEIANRCGLSKQLKRTSFDIVYKSDDIINVYADIYKTNIDVTAIIDTDELYADFLVVLTEQEFGDIPMDPVSETINKPWHRFPAGTHREKIWHWFEGTFNINIKDLLY